MRIWEKEETWNRIMNWIGGAEGRAKNATSEKRRWVQSWIVFRCPIHLYLLFWAFSPANNWVIREKLSTRVVTRWVHTLMCSNRVNKLKCHFSFILFAFLVFFPRDFSTERKKENLIICCLTVTNFLLSFKDAGVFAFYSSNSYRGK